MFEIILHQEFGFGYILPNNMLHKIEKLFEVLIFGSRWIQAPLYAGLIVAAVLYSYKFLTELIHLIQTTPHISESALMLSILTLVDITMVCNLVIMVIIGGYATFVSKIDLAHHKDRPEWLEKIDAGTLKVKLASSLVSVSGIHLLKSFINIGNQNIQEVQWQIVIHVVFLLSAIMLAWTERITHPAYTGKKH